LKRRAVDIPNAQIAPDDTRRHATTPDGGKVMYPERDKSINVGVAARERSICR